jgi:NADH:ubiquinone oxidoreductase subunit 2 (subunit N)
MVAQDGFGSVLRIVFLVTSIFVLLFTLHSRELSSVHPGELVVLLLTVTAALMWMSNALNLALYLALETVSIASYVMVGYEGDRLSNEASLKYILFGAISTGTMLFGMSLLTVSQAPGPFDPSALAARRAGRVRPRAHGGHRHGARRASASRCDGAVSFLVPRRLPEHPPVTAFLSVGPKVAGFDPVLLLRGGPPEARRFAWWGGTGRRSSWGSPSSP